MWPEIPIAALISLMFFCVGMVGLYMIVNGKKAAQFIMDFQSKLFVRTGGIPIDEQSMQDSPLFKAYPWHVKHPIFVRLIGAWIFILGMAAAGVGLFAIFAILTDFTF